MNNSIEFLFSQNNYNGIDILPFRIISGIGNTMISAPHSVNQTRDECIKPADLYTGDISLNTTLYTGCPVIIKTKNLGDDANYYIEDLYKKNLLDYVANNNIG